MTVASKSKRRRRGLVRTVRRLVRHGPDRLLHAWRRRKAAAALERLGFPGTIVFVCHGNICRSPYAARAYRTIMGNGAGGMVRVRSGGFTGPGRPSPPEAQAEAARRGVSLETHVSRLITKTDVQEADLIVVMNGRQRRAIRREFGRRGVPVIILGDLDPEAIDAREIRDPVNRSQSVFGASYERIDRCLGGLLNAFRGGAVDG